MHFMGYFIAMFYATLDCLLNTADTKNLSAVARQIIRTCFCKDARNNRIGAAAKIFCICYLCVPYGQFRQLVVNFTKAYAILLLNILLHVSLP